MQKDDEATRAKIAQQFIQAIPHAHALGMEIEAVGQDGAVISMDWKEEFVGDARSGVIHGGVISALMDTCCGAAVLAQTEGAVSAATIDLRIDYMRGATPRQRITAEAQCFHVTRSVAFVRATVTDGDEGSVATATGAFTIGR